MTNLSMVAHVQIYITAVECAAGHAAVELAARVSHARAELTAHRTAGLVFGDAGEFEQAMVHAEHVLTLVRRLLGARRFEALGLKIHSIAVRMEVRPAEALDQL